MSYGIAVRCDECNLIVDFTAFESDLDLAHAFNNVVRSEDYSIAPNDHARGDARDLAVTLPTRIDTAEGETRSTT